MRKLQLFAAIVAMLALYPLPSAAGDYTGEEMSGDIVTVVLVGGAYGVALARGDGEGEHEWMRSTGVSLVINTALRGAFNSTYLGKRPNGHDYAFPSGHSAFVVSSAQFLMDRYGWQYGVPAYLLVSYVSWVRVDTDHHHWRDIIAGAAVSWSVSKLTVTPQGATHIAPIVGPEWLGIRIERSF